MRFRVGVQRAWKFQFGGLLWGFRKVFTSGFKMLFLKPSWGGAFPALPDGGLELRFRVEV